MTEISLAVRSKLISTLFCIPFFAAVLVAPFRFAVPVAEAAQLSLSWTAPTTYSDGAPLTDIAGFRLYSGSASGNYQEVLDIGYLTDYTVGNLSEDATYYFAVTAYDTSLRESGYSNEVRQQIAALAAAEGVPARDGILKGIPGKTAPDIADALQALQISTGAISPTAVELAHGDIVPLDAAGRPGGDGRIDIADALGILRMALEL